MLAAAKINLALHVTGQRADGYHVLDSLVCFADFGDILSVAPAPDLSLSLSGPRAKDLPIGADNLVLRAARSFGTGQGAMIRLEKRLPVAAGIGGGSADAAACLHALSQLWGQPIPGIEQQLALGADVPACVVGRTLRMQGVGERISPIDHMPKFDAVLINPGIALSTPTVFRGLTHKQNPPLEALPKGNTPAEWLDWLKRQRNDLEAPAVQLAPRITEVLTALQQTDGSQRVSMSGSGATCFGIYASAKQAREAAKQIAANYPNWWIRATRLG